jgi:serine/threonine protein kinase
MGEVDISSVSPGDACTMESLESGVRIGDFQIVKRLGAGGMGVVYLARQVSLDRLVALKVLGSALTDHSDIARLHREARAVARLNHPGIADVYFVGQDHEVCYIAMEYIDGASLRDVLKRVSTLSQAVETMDWAFSPAPIRVDGPPEVRFDLETLTYASQPPGEGKPAEPDALTPEAKRLTATLDYIRRSCEIARDAASALAHAHERGVVHRDVKPENILLDRQGAVHLIDFGLARFFEDVTLTNTGGLVGTPMYMSPEQVTGRLKVDHRTDIYSLGLTLYELLAVRRPIVAPTREGVLRQVVTKSLTPVSWKNDAVPRGLEGVVHRATAKDPDERYQRASDLADDLQRYLDGATVAAPPYRYRFDEREILAERPREMTSIASLFFMLATLTGLLTCIALTGPILGLGIHRGDPGTFSNRIRDSLAGLLSISAVSLAAGAIGGGLVSGKRWALWAALLYCVSFPVAIVLSLSLLGVDKPRLYFAFWVLAAALFFVLPVLLRRKTRDWFSLAERLRSEHRQQATGR